MSYKKAIKHWEDAYHFLGAMCCMIVSMIIVPVKSTAWAIAAGTGLAFSIGVHVMVKKALKAEKEAQDAEK